MAFTAYLLNLVELILSGLTMRRTFALLLVALLMNARAAPAQCRILHRSDELFQPDTASRPYRTIYPRGSLSRYLVARPANGGKQLFAKKSVWGYVDGANRIWRCYHTDVYEVVRVYPGWWVEYRADRMADRRGNRSTFPLFSKTPDSRPYANWTEAMADSLSVRRTSATP